MPIPELVGALADLVLPRWCLGCAEPGPPLCRECLPRELIESSRFGLPVISAGSYEGALRAAIVAYKERGRRDVARSLGALLAGPIAQVGEAGGTLVPVPSSAAAIRARGGDHVLRLARAAHSQLVVRRALRLERVVADSASLDVAARRANLANAMRAAAPPAAGLGAVIVDDIVTTGATIGEARRALTEAGWNVRAAVTVAATQLRIRSRHADTARSR